MRQAGGEEGGGQTAGLQHFVLTPVSAPSWCVRRRAAAPTPSPPPAASSWKISQNYRVTGFEKSQEPSVVRRRPARVVTLMRGAAAGERQGGGESRGASAGRRQRGGTGRPRAFRVRPPSPIESNAPAGPVRIHTAPTRLPRGPRGAPPPRVPPARGACSPCGVQSVLPTLRSRCGHRERDGSARLLRRDQRRRSEVQFRPNAPRRTPVTIMTPLRRRRARNEVGVTGVDWTAGWRDGARAGTTAGRGARPASRARARRPPCLRRRKLLSVRVSGGLFPRQHVCACGFYGRT